MVMSHHQNSAQNLHSLIANKSLENLEIFRYFEKVVTSKNCIHEEIKSRLNLGNACYHSV
jgi:hypothetical protein